MYKNNKKYLLATIALCAMLSNVQAAQKSFKVTFMDQRGKVITLDHKPARIASLFPCFPPMYYSVNGSIKEIVIGDKRTHYFFNMSAYKDIFPSIMKMQTGSLLAKRIPNIEAVANAHPDFILYGPISHKMNALERLGIPVMGWTWHPGTHKRIEHMRMIGYLTGNNARAQVVLKESSDVESWLKNKLKNTRKIRTVHVFEGTKKNVVTVSGNNEWINYELSGLTNIAAKNSAMFSRTLDKERLLKYNPEIIFIRRASSTTPSTLYNDPALKSVSAIKNKRVYKTLSFFPHVPEFYLMEEWMAILAHPNKFSTKEKRGFRNKVKQAFKKLYKKNISNKDVDSIISMKYNAKSKLYNYFK